MKLLIIMMLSTAALAWEGTDIVRAMPEMTCFGYERHEPVTHAWQKTAGYRSATWVLLKKDATGYLVAQPVPSCEDNGEAKDDVCPFWLRTSEFGDSLVSDKFLKVRKCPKVLTKEFFQKLIKVKFSHELEF